MQSEVLAYVFEAFESSATCFNKDISALTHDDLDRKWGDSSRRAYDVIYEVGLLHRRSAQKLRGEDPGPMPWQFGEEWLQAPEEMRVHDRACAFFGESSNELLDTAREKATVAGAEEAMKIVKELNFALVHTIYHDAQLNFIQALKGDLAVHW